MSKDTASASSSLSDDPEGSEAAKAFVHDFCQRHNLPKEPGNSSIERRCSSLATEAREEFKTKLRRSSSQHNQGGLSLSEKYAIRLQNNRRSAHAAKVYSEVQKRCISHFLTELDRNTNDPLKDKRNYEALLTKYAELRRKYEDTKRERDILNGQLQEARLQNSEFKQDHLRRDDVKMEMALEGIGSTGAGPSAVNLSTLQPGGHTFSANVHNAFEQRDPTSSFSTIQQNVSQPLNTMQPQFPEYPEAVENVPLRSNQHSSLETSEQLGLPSATGNSLHSIGAQQHPCLPSAPFPHSTSNDEIIFPPPHCSLEFLPHRGKGSKS